MEARHQGLPISQLSRRPSARQIEHDPDATASSRSLQTIGSSDADESPAQETDVEGGGSALKGSGLRRRSSTWLNVNKVAECREKSQSAWLHFPHVELVFLLFAFEGAAASQVAALVENASPGVFFLALASLVSLFVFRNMSFARAQPRPGKTCSRGGRL